MSDADTRRSATTVLSTLLAVIGAALIVQTFRGGGGAFSIGVLLGVLFLIAGLGRMWIARTQR